MSGDAPVTTTVTRRVRPGHEAFCEQFLAGIISAASEFPGHLGVVVFRPESASAGEYRTVYRFDTAEHLRAWLDSDEHAAWLERAEPHVIGPMHTSFVTGLESWFTVMVRPSTPMLHPETRWPKGTRSRLRVPAKATLARCSRNCRWP